MIEMGNKLSNEKVLINLHRKEPFYLLKSLHGIELWNVFMVLVYMKINELRK